MGTAFSGRWGRRSTRPRVTDCRALDVRQMARTGLLEPGSAFTVVWGRSAGEVPTRGLAETGGIRLNGVRVALSGFEPGRGGWVPLFSCPTCPARCFRLYSDGGPFACRACLRLFYPTESEGQRQRAIRRAMRAISGAGYELGRKGLKPKWQRWPTFRRLHAQAENGEAALVRIVRDADQVVTKVRAADGKRKRRNS
jgi:hypothetical protein